MTSYRSAYNVAYDAALDYLVRTALAMKDNDMPDSGDIEFVAKDAVANLWAAIHGSDSPDDPSHDKFWDYVTDAAHKATIDK